MKKLIYAIALTFAAAGAIAMLDGCGTDDTSPDNIAEELTSSYTYDIVEPEAPEGGYRIYLDASGSMPGYFTDGLTEYIKIVSGIQGGNDSTKVYFWGDDTREVKDLNSTITKGNYKGSASLFQDIFGVMAKKAKSDKALTFLVTDGIVSNASKVTNQRTGYTISDLPLLPAKIKDAVGDSMAVAVFRCKIPFNGKYWNIDNKKIDIKADRPIFVFAIGYPGAVADLRGNIMSKKREMENFIEKKPEQLYMGIFDKKNNKNPFRDAYGDCFITSDDTTTITLDPGCENFQLALDMPKWIKEMGANPKTDGKISIVNTGTKNTIDMYADYEDGAMYFTTKDGAVQKANNGDYNVNYTIVYRPSDKWNNYNCEDDRAITSDTLCDQTFGLNAILKGFELATNQPDTLFKSSFKFTY